MTAKEYARSLSRRMLDPLVRAALQPDGSILRSQITGSDHVEVLSAPGGFFAGLDCLADEYQQVALQHLGENASRVDMIPIVYLPLLDLHAVVRQTPSCEPYIALHWGTTLHFRLVFEFFMNYLVQRRIEEGLKSRGLG